MDRRKFTKACLMCLSAPLIIPVVSSCQSTHYVSGVVTPNGISVAKSEFNYVSEDQQKMRQYIIVRNDSLQFPIYLYRFSDTEYSALLMKCTHQGNELQASGDHLTCAAHGSEFNNKGMVAQGPAEHNLRAFRVTAEGDTLLIDLRA